MLKKIILLFIFVSYSLNCEALQISENQRFLNFSDIHFNPFYDTTLVGELVKENYTVWESIFSQSQIKTISAYGSDSNFPLLVSSLKEMHDRIPNPDFIIITGDFMAHNFNENFERYAGTNNTDSLNQFIEKTIRFVTSMMKKYFPASTMFPSVGNDDAYCGNYMIEPDGQFLKMLSEVWEPLVNHAGNNPSYKSDFSKGGYCLLNFPHSSNYKMIILNTVFFSPNYINMCGDTALDPGKAELEWLTRTLADCLRNNQKVWISYHIPPGVDIFGTIHGQGDCRQKIVKSWKVNYNDAFVKIIRRYSSIITSGFAGHFHRDDFRIFSKYDNPNSYILIAPSISPVYGNNPSYRIFFYNRSDYTLINYISYAMNLSTERDPYWNQEYNFANTYNQKTLTLSSLNNVYHLIHSDTEIRKKYIKYYTANNRNSFAGDYSNWFYNWCGISHLSAESYGDCLCQDSTNTKPEINADGD